MKKFIAFLALGCFSVMVVMPVAAAEKHSDDHSIVFKHFPSPVDLVSSFVEVKRYQTTGITVITASSVVPGITKFIEPVARPPNSKARIR